MRSSVFSFVFITALVGGAQYAQAEGDVEAGKKVFKKCQACHVVDSDKKKVGPSLQNVMMRQAGTVEGFKYSKAMVAAGEDGLVWDEESLSAYLKAPKEFVKGTKMAFAGLKKDADLVNVIAYIKQFSPMDEAASDEGEAKTE